MIRDENGNMTKLTMSEFGAARSYTRVPARLDHDVRPFDAHLFPLYSHPVKLGQSIIRLLCDGFITFG